MGSSDAADLAGKTPKDIPITADTPTAITIAYKGTVKTQVKPLTVATTATSQLNNVPNKIPIIPPKIVTKTDSIKNSFKFF